MSVQTINSHKHYTCILLFFLNAGQFVFVTLGM